MAIKDGKTPARARAAKSGKGKRAAKGPKYTIALTALYDGRTYRGEVLAQTEDGKQVSDEGRLNNGGELRKLARRVADKLGVDPVRFERELSALWAAKLAELKVKQKEQKENGQAEQGESGTSPGGGDGGGRGPSMATRMVDLARQAGVELFRDEMEAAYATFEVVMDGQPRRRETWPLGSRRFRRWLGRQLYDAEAKAPGSQAVQDAINVLEAEAHARGTECPVYVRTAEAEGKVYLDLANAGWQAIEIDAQGWRVVENPPVRFRRSKGLRPLPVPERGGTLDLLRPFVNVASEDSWLLLLACILAALRRSGPFPVMTLRGEPGSAKTTHGKVVQRLVDPSVVDLRSSPKEPRDLMIAGTNGWLVAYDNLSYLPQWLSDALCRLATGGGFGTRQLYSDDEEQLFDALRPVILTSITDVATASDLLDRAVDIQLEPIPPERRRTEAEFWAAFERQRPLILGALLDAVSAGLRLYPGLRLDRLPRMADFARWAEACLRGAGYEANAFLRAYSGNRASADVLALEASPVASLVLKGILGGQRFEKATSTEILDWLNRMAGDETRKQKSWPARPNLLTGELQRAAPNLRRAGLIVEIGRTRRGSSITLLRRPNPEQAGVPSSPSSPSSPAEQTDGANADRDVSCNDNQGGDDGGLPIVTPSSPGAAHRHQAGARVTMPPVGVTMGDDGGSTGDSLHNHSDTKGLRRRRDDGDDGDDGTPACSGGDGDTDEGHCPWESP